MSTGDQLLSNLGVLTSASNLPRSPWIYHVPDTSIVVTVIYVQVIVVSEVDVLTCLLYAANDVIAHLSTPGSEFIDEDELDWNSDPVRLSLNPLPHMTWPMWGATIEGLTHFLDLYDAVAILFEARDLLIGGSVGSGSIFNTWPGEQ